MSSDPGFGEFHQKGVDDGPCVPCKDTWEGQSMERTEGGYISGLGMGDSKNFGTIQILILFFLGIEGICLRQGQ